MSRGKIETRVKSGPPTPLPRFFSIIFIERPRVLDRPNTLYRMVVRRNNATRAAAVVVGGGEGAVDDIINDGGGDDDPLIMTARRASGAAIIRSPSGARVPRDPVRGGVGRERRVSSGAGGKTTRDRSEHEPTVI